MAVQVRPIGLADIDRVAEFLEATMGSRIPADTWARAMQVPWKVDAPNHGFMLLADDQVVGAYLAFYSERTIDGRGESFCNLGPWCVRPEYRMHSVRLVQALLGQQGWHFTDFSPSQRVAELNRRLGFHQLDTVCSVIPNLPWPPFYRRARISSSPQVLERTVHPADLDLYRDHADAAAVRHTVLASGGQTCYVVFRKERIRALRSGIRLPVPVPVAYVLYVSNEQLFRRLAWRFGGHLLLEHKVLATFVELRLSGGPLKPSLRLAMGSNRKMYKSPTLRDEHVDYLYSELVCLPW